MHRHRSTRRGFLRNNLYASKLRAALVLPAPATPPILNRGVAQIELIGDPFERFALVELRLEESVEALTQSF